MKFQPNMYRLMLTGAAAVVLGTPALAGPFDPAYKGTENSVHAAFDRTTPNGDWGVTQFSTGPSSFLLIDQGPNAVEDGNEADVMFTVPNFIEQLPMKRMRLQLFFSVAVDYNLIDLTVVGHDPQQPVVNEIGRGGDHSAGVYYIDFEILPNPDWETIMFNGDPAGAIAPGNFFRLEVDTVSIPEPASMTLLAIGVMATLRRQRG